MLRIRTTKLIPHPFAVVLDQYFDYEHIAHVHPATLGEYRLVENRGHTLVYDQHWPAGRRGKRAVSRVVQTYRPPGDIGFEFVAGKHRGTTVRSELRPHPGGTEVTETYHVPHLPDWGWLRRLVRPWVVRAVDRVWAEDLAVGVCVGGWPGTPGQPNRAGSEEWRRPLPPGRYPVGPAAAFPAGSRTVVETAGGPVLVVRSADGFRAVHPTCPHTGGPLGLGAVAGGCVVCPWHGARFDLATGTAVAGPTKIPLPTYRTEVEDSELVVVAGGHPVSEGSHPNPFDRRRPAPPQ